MNAILLATTIVVFVNGNIYTLDERRPRAQAIAVQDGKILDVGTDEQIRGLSRSAKVVDLRGRTVIPGLIDAHGHLGGLGSLALGALDLRGTKSYDEVIAAVVERAKEKKKGEWIVGSGWDHESWPEKALPTHARLSAAVPDHPVWISRVDGHAGLASLAALQAAGLVDTPGSRRAAPEGGAILLDEKGQPTGVLVDRAMDLVERAIPGDAAGAPSLERIYLAAQQRCFEVGLTGVHDAGVSSAEIAALKGLAADGRLKLRVYAMVAADAEYVRKNAPIVGDRLTVRSVKLVADGAMGSRGAWLLAPYSDRPQDERGGPYVGLPILKRPEVEDFARLCLERGYQVATHAIGDRANREVLDAYEAAFAKSGKPAWKAAHEARFRLEHAQRVDPADIPRLAELSVIASMQPTHCTSDMRWLEKRLGPERLPGCYAWASMLRHHVGLALGSDFPVESPDPILGIYAACTRQDLAGEPEGGFMPGEKLTREEAVRGFTQGAAYAAFEEDRRGTIALTRDADFVVLDRDILTSGRGELLKARVVMTVVGGEVVFERKEK